MKENKDLLLKDLCARLPYKVKAQFPDEYGGYTSAIESIDIDGFIKDFEGIQYEIGDFKPYFFPLSSMTEEQKIEFDKMSELDIEYTITQIKNDSLIWTSGLNRFNWFLKNHFDVYGLIEKGLAIDATNLNIY